MDEPADDAFQAPEATSKPKAYSTDPLPGGELPDIGKLFSETMAEFTDNLGPYVMAGLGLTVVVVPITFIAILLIYALMLGGMFGVAVGGAVVGVGISETVSEELGALVMILSQFLSIAVAFGALILAVGGLMALIAPLNASLVRAVAAQQRGEKELEFTSVFSSLGQDAVKVIGVALLLAVLSTLGAMACYLPALGVIFFFGFASSFVALHRLGPMAALRSNWSHATANLQHHVLFGAVYIGVLMVGSYIPILGSMFIAAFHVRAYRMMFGDGEQPVLEVAA